jgi:hypothetical protein
MSIAFLAAPAVALMRTAVLVSALALVSPLVLAQQVDIPVTNWAVPPYTQSAGGLTMMTDTTGPRVFIAVLPCRVVDTRNPAGPYGGPALATNVARTFDIDNGPCPGLPAGVDAYSLNFGGILPPADGFLTAWQTGSSQPVVSQLNLVGGEVVANAAIVPAGNGGAINVLVNIGPTHVYIDINGYFADSPGNPANNFLFVNDAAGGATAIFRNLSTTCSGDCGIFAVTSSGHAISGIAGEVSGDFNAGVRGHTTSTGGAGVYGSANALSGWGGYFENIHANGVGVNGDAGFRGVQGRAGSHANNSAGVYGFNGGSLVGGSFTTAGVRGETADAGHGVLGLTTGTDAGVAGFYIDSQTTNGLSGGYLGLGPSAGVFFFNGLSGTGTKSFIEPHPTDASKVIKFVSLEGNEAGTYFRGRGKFQNGLARIRVPEDFRIVTDPEGLTVQITPIGGMASVGILRIGLDEIVAQSSRDLEFSYMVNGVRRAYPHVETIVENERYLVPQSADARVPVYLSPDERQRMIDNGTYREDGTVNMETARRLGWDKIWEQRSRPRPQPQLTP